MSHELPNRAPASREAAHPQLEKEERVVPKGEGTPAEERMKLRAVVVDLEHLAEQQARTKAERTLTETKEKMSGVSGFFKKMWKHGLAREYYRQKEIAKARREIHEKGNLYAAEDPSVEQKAHEEAMKAVVNRFSSEYEQEMIHQGESKRVLGSVTAVKESLKSIVGQYAAGGMSDDDFNEAKKQVLHGISRSESAKENTMYADNFLELAKQARDAVRHGVALDKLDIDFDNIVLGKARDNIKTEAKYNGIDRAIEGFKGSRVGKFMLAHKWASEAGIASAIAIAGGAGAFALRRATSSRLAAWGSFGATAVLGAGVIAIGENKRTKEDRAQHARERAQGRDFDRENSPRRTEMEKYIYDMRSAAELSAGLRTALYGAEGNDEKHQMTPEEAEQAMQKLTDIEARIQLMDTQKIDLLAYSDVTKIERERQELDLMRAQAKVSLRKVNADTDRALAMRVNAQMNALMKGDSGIEAIDARFKEMKRNRVWKAAAIGAAVGVVAGVAGQEIAAYMTPDQTGFFEHLTNGMDVKGSGESHMTTLETLRGAFFSHARGGGAEHLASFGNAHFTLPKDMDMVPDGNGGYNLIQHNSVFDSTLATGLHLDQHGALTPESLQALNHEGIVGHHDGFDAVTGKSVTANVPMDQNYLDHHPGLNTHHVSRGLWYDNETPKPVFDENELKLKWGGDHGTGIDANSKYTFTVKDMLAGGSHHAGLSADAMKLAKEGHLKLLLSISEGTQAHPIEVDINPDGTVHIDPHSEAGKILFEQDANHHAVFKGRFAEVAQMMGTKDGTDHVRILATYEGNGVTHIMDTVKGPPNFVPHNTLTAPSDYIFDPPPMIPIFARTPLEPINGKKGPNPFLAFYYGYGGPVTKEQIREYERALSPRLRQNPDTALNARKEGEDYFSRQDPEYLKKVDILAAEAGPMSKECKLAVCIPVAGHQEANNIERTLSAYLHQTSDSKSFEIVLFVNQPDVAPNGERIKSDGTLQKIEEFKKQHPELAIRVMQAVLPHSEARIGNIRKMLSDATLRRSLERGGDSDLVMVSNDADLKGVAPEYVSNFIERFSENKKADAFMGQLDWDPESYVRNPLAHIGTRLMQYIAVQHRKAKRGIESSGANFAYRSSIYAAIGGYDANVHMGEDNNFGRKILFARRGASGRTPIAYAGARVSRLYTSSRRAEKAIKDGLAPIEQWEKGFSAFDDEVRKVKWEDTGQIPDYNNPDVVRKLTSELENIINRTLTVSSNWWSNAPYATYQRRALGWLGIKYTLVGNNRIHITDASKLIEGLKKYSEEGMEIMARKTGMPLPERKMAPIPEPPPMREKPAQSETKQEGPMESQGEGEKTQSEDVSPPLDVPAKNTEVSRRLFPKHTEVRAPRIPIRPSAERRSAPRKLEGRPNPTTQNRARPGR